MQPTRTGLVALAAAAATVAGCGGGAGKAASTGTTARTQAAQGAPPPVVGALVPIVYPHAGVRFSAPEGWRTQPGEPPLVATVQTGQVTVAVWRYPRPGQQLPVTHPALIAARDALVAAIRRRDQTFRVIQAKLLHVGPERAVEVLGVGTVAGQRRAIRSTHIYSHGSEYVIDAYAPQTLFARVNAQVFGPLLGSVRIAPPRA